MAIRVGENSNGLPLPSPFPSGKLARSPYKGFKHPPFFNAGKGHNMPLIDQSPRIGEFVIVEELDDYLICDGYDPYNDKSITVPVAKPYRLRRLPFDGESIAYKTIQVGYSYLDIGKRQASATIGEKPVTETQLITEDYLPGDVLIAMQTRNVDRKGTDITSSQGERVEWVDLNFSGRAWAVESDNSANV